MIWWVGFSNVCTHDPDACPTKVDESTDESHRSKQGHSIVELFDVVRDFFGNSRLGLLGAGAQMRRRDHLGMVDQRPVLRRLLRTMIRRSSQY